MTKRKATQIIRWLVLFTWIAVGMIILEIPKGEVLLGTAFLARCFIIFRYLI